MCQSTTSVTASRCVYCCLKALFAWHKCLHHVSIHTLSGCMQSLPVVVLCDVVMCFVTKYTSQFFIYMTCTHKTLCELSFVGRFPDDDEGAMTNTCNTLVSNRAHVQYANHLNLTRYMAQNLKYQRPNARYPLFKRRLHQIPPPRPAPIPVMLLPLRCVPTRAC